MRALLALAVALTSGCNALYGLDRPQLMGDAAVVEDGDVVDGGQDALADARPDAVPDALMFVCPNGYAAINGSLTKYRFNSGSTEWPNAAANCADDGVNINANTHLVVLSSLAEYNDLRVLLGNNAAWVGHSDRNDADTHLWVTAEPNTVPPQWANGEPNDAQSRCTRYDEGVLFDTPCALSGPYVCECDGYADDPTRY